MVLRPPPRCRKCLRPTDDQGLLGAPCWSSGIQSYLHCRPCWCQGLPHSFTFVLRQAWSSVFTFSASGQQRRPSWGFLVLADSQKGDILLLSTETSNHCWFLGMLWLLVNYRSQIGLFDDFCLPVDEQGSRRLQCYLWCCSSASLQLSSLVLLLHPGRQSTKGNWGGWGYPQDAR